MKPSITEDIQEAARIWKAFPSESLFDGRAFCEEVEAMYDNDADRMKQWAFTVFAWWWAQEGFWMLQTSHTFGAALMCTETEGATEDLHIPARAFRLTVPNGLLRVDDNFEYRYVYVLTCEKFDADRNDRVPFSMIAISDEQALLGGGRPRATMGYYPLVTLLKQEVVKFCHGEESLDEKRRLAKSRCMVLAQRLVTGLLYTLQHTDNFVSRVTGGQNSRRERSDPTHRIVTVGSPIKVNFKPQIEQWISSDPKRQKPPNFQHVVRGHYKRTVVGIGRCGRRVVWIQPYWRGPEDAPILVRPYDVGRGP